MRSGSQTSYLRKLFIQKSRALSHVANFLYSPSVVVIHIVVKICRIFVAIRLRTISHWREYSPASGREYSQASTRGEYTVHIDARSTLLEICGDQQPSNSNGTFC